MTEQNTAAAQKYETDLLRVQQQNRLIDQENAVAKLKRDAENERRRLEHEEKKQKGVKGLGKAALLHPKPPLALPKKPPTLHVNLEALDLRRIQPYLKVGILEHTHRPGWVGTPNRTKQPVPQSVGSGFFVTDADAEGGHIGKRYAYEQGKFVQKNANFTY